LPGFPKSWWARQGLNLRPHPCEGWEYGHWCISADLEILENPLLLPFGVRQCISWMFHGLHCEAEMADLSRIGERDKLKTKAGDEPHWQRLRQGCYLGFRPSKRGGKGTWFARAYDPDASRYSRKALGDYGALSGHEVFTQAKRDAESWAETVESGGIRARELVT